MHRLQKVFSKCGSLKQQLICYNAILLLFVLLIAALFISNNAEMLAGYETFSTQYRDLSTFYREAGAAGVAAQNFLYSKGTAEMESYSLHTYAARDVLQRIGERAQHQELQWRVSLLQNMLDTHSETFARLRENRFESAVEYSREYDFLVSTSANIAATAPQYYNLLTDEMNLSRQALEHSWRMRTVAALLGTGAMVLLAVLFSSIYILGITNPIQKLVRNIHKIKQGHYDLREVDNAGREIAVLCDAFSDMAQSVQLHIAGVEENARLEKKLLETENSNLKMNELLMETELKALQGQMNPHFLFNTLSMISKMAYMENAPETSEMMETVADLLRYSLDKSSKTSDLLGEIECVRNYYEIQNKRIGHRVRFSLRIGKSLENMPMPGMVLQPLIENAVLHGVADMTSGAFIDVAIYQDGCHTFLTVEDNGKGMAEELIRSILDGEPAPPGEAGSNIGLRNVLKRLRIFYGNDFNARIVSDLGSGTLVVLTLPI